MINNIRLCVRLQKQNLEQQNIAIKEKHFDPSFIISLKETNDNFIQGNLSTLAAWSIDTISVVRNQLYRSENDIIAPPILRTSRWGFITFIAQA